MPITDPNAVHFANTRIRIAADAIGKLYNIAKQITNEWNALGGDKLIPNTAEIVVDGSAEDGRPPITGAMCNNIINRLLEQIADAEAVGKAKLNTVLQVAVNTVI